MLDQRTWRRLGIVSLVICGVMAWSGTRSGVTSLSPLFQVGYWTVFLGFLLLAVYVAVLDLRYIRMQYSHGEREVFEETLGSEEFRTVLRDACQKTPEQGAPPPRDD